MTAASNYLSDGRAVLGLGASGPQVIEGFHGVPYTAPVAVPQGDRDMPPGLRASACSIWAITINSIAQDQGTGLGKP